MHTWNLCKVNSKMADFGHWRGKTCCAKCGQKTCIYMTWVLGSYSDLTDVSVTDMQEERFPYPMTKQSHFAFLATLSRPVNTWCTHITSTGPTCCSVTCSQYMLPCWDSVWERWAVWPPTDLPAGTLCGKMGSVATHRPPRACTHLVESSQVPYRVWEDHSSPKWGHQLNTTGRSVRQGDLPDICSVISVLDNPSLNVVSGKRFSSFKS